MRVRAITRGYYGERIREEGDEFPLQDEKHFSHIWMEPLDGGRAPRESSAPAKKAKTVKDKTAKPDFAA